MISGIFIIILMIAFFAVVFWAYSDKQKAQFKYMSSLPLDEELNTVNKGDENGND